MEKGSGGTHSSNTIQHPKAIPRPTRARLSIRAPRAILIETAICPSPYSALPIVANRQRPNRSRCQFKAVGFWAFAGLGADARPDSFAAGVANADLSCVGGGCAAGLARH